MDDLSINNVKITLIQYRLLSCNAESNVEANPNSGGSVVITSEINCPTSPNILKKGETFPFRVFIEVVGKSKDSKDIAFSASCAYEGKYLIVECEKNGVPTEKNDKLWSLAMGQLHPLVSQFVTDLVLKMGFKNVNVPPLIPGRYTPKQKPKMKSLTEIKSKRPTTVKIK